MVPKTLVAICIASGLAMCTATVATAVPTPARPSTQITRAVTPNPTCGSDTGETECIEAYQNGLAFTWSGPAALTYSPDLKTGTGGGAAGLTDVDVQNSFGVSILWVGNDTTGFTAINAATDSVVNPAQFAGSASGFTYFDPLPAGEYDGDTGPGDLPFQVTFDLEVGGNLPLFTRGVAAPVAAMTSTPTGQGYWIAGADGSVQAFGDALNYGSLVGTPLNAPIVGMASTPDGRGYWLLGADGGVFGFGDAQFYGSTGSIKLNKPAIGMAATPDGKGYWFVASDGGIFAYGDAGFYGSMGAKPLNQPVVGMAADRATGGYWLVARDGGVFSFNAPFYGSTGNLVLNKPVVGMEAAPDGSGYRFVASDGGVFSYNLPYSGSMGGQPLNQPIVAMASSGSAGYWLLARDGGLFAFGGAPFDGAG